MKRKPFTNKEYPRIRIEFQIMQLSSINNKIMRILVVDNSRVIRQIIREELETNGFDVIDTDLGEEVYRILSEKDVDLVTLSVELHDINGYDICRTIRNGGPSERVVRNSNIPIIFVTSNDTIEERRKGFQVGAADFISKPFGKGEVSSVIRKLLKPEANLQGMEALVVDDSKFAREIVSGALNQIGVTTHQMNNGKDAISFIKKNPRRIDMVITDVVMPGIQGDELVKIIRKERTDPDLPILVMSGEDHNLSIMDIFKAGATDYIMKPFIKEELLARLHVHMKTRLLNRLLMERLEDLEHANLKLRSIASRDPLTGLYNRRAFFDRLQDAKIKKKKEDLYLSFIIFDIDHFKHINDQYGHITGDQVLRETGLIIRATSKHTAIVGRLGGEEFGAFVLSRDPGSAVKISERIRSRIEQYNFLQNGTERNIKATISIGVYISPPDENLTAERLYGNADEMLYDAKTNGRNRICHKTSKGEKSE